MPFEHHTQPILPLPRFFVRVLAYVGYGLAIVAVFLLVGVLGYHFLVGLSVIDAVLNASMILSGMGPVDPIASDAGKIFASAYAILSGVVFAVVTGIVISPILHRVLHHLQAKKRR
jgi:hypothetical protein